MNAAGGTRTLELLDVNGRVLRTEQLTMSGTFLRRSIPVPDLPRGANLVRLRTMQGESVKRLMLR